MFRCTSAVYNTVVARPRSAFAVAFVAYTYYFHTMSRSIAVDGPVQHGAFQVVAPDGKQDVGYLSKPIADRFPQISQRAIESKPRFQGTPDEYALAHNQDADLARRLKNKVRTCPQCGKNVAYTLPFCNGCGRSLADVEISYTNNVFTGFAYGIQKGPFPFTISLRHQDERYIVFDDPLALTVCHVNVIPTHIYMSDWKYLLKKPQEGLKLIDELLEQSFAVFKQEFWSNVIWRNKHFQKPDQLTDDSLRALVAAGFNSPPSQYQLHLQFMLPPFLPFQYMQYLKGRHFTHGRFFPIEYVRGILALDKPFDVQESTTLDEIITFYSDQGVDYDTIHKEHYERYGTAHESIAQWNESDFAAISTEEGVYDIKNLSETYGQEALAGVQAQDKLTLQAYGRPYKDGKPSGTYYKYAKVFPDGLADF